MRLAAPSRCWVARRKERAKQLGRGKSRRRVGGLQTAAYGPPVRRCEKWKSRVSLYLAWGSR